MLTRPVLLAATLALGAGAARADTPGADWISRDQVAKILADKGYTDVRKLEADDGHWEGDATLKGTEVEVHVDPHGGAITKSEPDDD